MLPAERTIAGAGASWGESEQAFRLSMPESYRGDFGDDAVSEHARIVARRQGAFVHLETCGVDGTTAPPTQWICVVSDDRPGLLSLLSVALSAHGLDVKNARVYCRNRAGRGREAVDFFAVQPLPGSPVAQFDVEAVATMRDSIAGLLSKDTDVEWLARRSSPPSQARPVTPATLATAPTASAAFAPDRDRDLLVVETDDRPNLLLAITLALYRRRLNIVRSSIATDGSRARDDFDLSEFDGSRLPEMRKREALGAVVAAIGRLANEQTQ